ncbi:MAG: glycosyltransferase family 4 protein [Actinomycetia bacterium]|nr:glycosyltransferase family 4 protein [Actinomycetes bacterium]
MQTSKKKVAIIIDHFCLRPFGSAISYPRGLLGALSNLSIDSLEITLVGFNLSDLAKTLPFISRFKLLEIPMRKIPCYFDFRHFAIVPFILRKKGFDAVIEMTQSIPFLFKDYRLCGIVTDITPLMFPRLFPHPLMTYLRHMSLLRLAFRRCDRIVAISKSTKNDVERCYGIAEENITVIPLGFDKTAYEEIDINSTYGIKGSFILSVGTFQPRKNFSLLIRAFDELLRRGKRSDLSLVIVGELGWKYQDILETYLSAEHKNNILLLHGIGDNELFNFYEQCLYFVYPSLYEGFGLPILEAMAFGKAVIISNTSSMAEFPVDEQFRIDPTKLEDLIQSMSILLYDEKTRLDQEIINSNNAKDYSWSKSAELFLTLISELVFGRSGSTLPDIEINGKGGSSQESRVH